MNVGGASRGQFWLCGWPGAAQKLPWETNDGQSDEKQFVKFLYPEQVSVAANQTVSLNCTSGESGPAHQLAHSAVRKSLIPTQLMVG